MNVTEIKPWRARVQSRALKMADEIVENFNEKIQGAALLLPEPIVAADRHDVLNHFIDALNGAVCRCITVVTQDASNRMEDAVVANVRAKFAEIRKQNVGLSRNMGEVPIEEE